MSLLLKASAAAGLAMLLLMAGARWAMPARLAGPVAEGGWTRRTRAAFVVGNVYPALADPATGRYFAWTTQTARLRLIELPLSQAHLVSLTVRSGRAPDQTVPTTTVRLDGAVVTTVRVTDQPQEVTFTVPAGRTRALILVETTPTIPAGSDTRHEWGIVIDDVAIAPASGHFRPSSMVVIQTGLATLAIVLGMFLCGVRGRLAALLSIAVPAGLVWLLLQDGAFLGSYAESVVRIALGAFAASLVVAAVRWRWPEIGGVPDWPAAAGGVIALSAVKVALFWHPLAIVGDAVFQIHRAQMVHGGDYFFTSVTPRPFFEFPYAIALYVAALPLWTSFRTEMDLIHLLRLLSIVADGVAGIVLYGAMRRQTGRTGVALVCALLWPLARAPFEALSNANLTNMFGQALFASALAGFAWWAASRSRPWALLPILGAVLASAFLSHFGTITVGLVIVGLVAVLLMVLGGRASRPAGIALVGLMIAAAGVSWLVYYSHFTPVYQATYQRLTTGERDDTSKLVAGPGVKIQRWWSGRGDDYGLPGVPVLVLAIAGLTLTVRRRDRSATSLVFSGWLLAWIGLSLLGIFTPITLRANLAAAPAFIVLAAVAIGAVAERSRLGQVAAVCLTCLAAWDGLQIGLLCIGQAPRW